MRTLGYSLIVGWVLSWVAVEGIAWATEMDADHSVGCSNFRCDFGDVPKAYPPLIAEPFVSFYRDSVVKPMRPYRDWRPTARQLPNAGVAKRHVSENAEMTSREK